MAKLVAISKSLAGLSHELGRQWITIGRAAGNAFQIVEPSVSGHHCEVQMRDHDLLVRDMRSTNGTFIRGKLITEEVLHPGEILRLGEVELRLELAAVPVPGIVSAPVLKVELPGKPAPAPGPRKPRVLLVDDSMAFLETVSEMFDAIGNKAWEIHKAAAADQALTILHQHQFDLAVLDINMPMLDGVQLLRMIHRRYPEIKKVILTGNASETLRATCLENGAELFLEKPTAPDGMRFVFNVLSDLIRWNQREGFSGTLRQVGLTDIIQIQCLSGSSCILEVHNPQTRGEIYIEAGVMIHAVAGELSGEKALNRLLSLDNGEFHLKTFKKPPERTVTGSWEFLLMEAARVRDEERGIQAGDDTVLVVKPAQTNTTAASAPLPTPKPEPQSPPASDKATAEALKDLGGEGDGIVVVATYDGAWHPKTDAK
jgi:CheY-like chemotaxis protein